MKNNLNSSYDIYYSYSIGYNCPNLQYICADESDIYEIKQRLLSAGNTNNVFFNSFCNSTSDGSHYTLNGNIKLDADNNGCTSTDPIYPNIKLKIKNAVDSGYAIANAQGNFAVELYSGTYTLRPELTNNYFIVTPTSTNVTFPEDTIPQIFCITPNGINHDVSVNLVPVHPVRPGFSDGIYKIVLKNKGNQFENGFILFNYDENKQDYISSSQTPSSIQSGQLTFTFSNLQLFETREILVTMRTNAPTDNPAVNVGDILVLSASANINMDENLDDNTQQINQTVIGSVDPNDKTCLEGNIITPNLVGKYVNYLIRFENTGTANAENVVVTDFIDLAKFDISSLQVTSTSHSCKTLISNGNKVQFVFDNINLPFTEPLKHGYVAFKIKTKPNLVIGDSLKNSADIYFDYNLPIKTNTASTRIDNIILGTKNTTNKDGSLSVYPNPSNGNFTVNFESKGNFPITIKMIDLKGSVVLEKNINHSEKSTFSFNDKDLPNGIYLININTEKENWLQKLMIVK
ncbi:MAG: T9SS type A sorting domain-containing protein [Chitinophagales bacterium]